VDELTKITKYLSKKDHL